jgi:hypothetical protein
MVLSESTTRRNVDTIKDNIDGAQQALDLTFSNVQNEDWMGALNTLNAALEQMQAAAWPLVKKAYDGGASKAAIARALNMPPSTLRGLKKSDGLDKLRAMLP